jgi:Mycoplasma protein of unknown function, DUF285
MNMKSLTMIVLSLSGCTMADGPRRTLVRQRRLLQPPASVQPEQHGGFKLGSLRKLYESTTATITTRQLDTVSRPHHNIFRRGVNCVPDPDAVDKGKGKGGRSSRSCSKGKSKGGSSRSGPSGGKGKSKGGSSRSRPSGGKGKSKGGSSRSSSSGGKGKGKGGGGHIRDRVSSRGKGKGSSNSSSSSSRSKGKGGSKRESRVLQQLALGTGRVARRGHGKGGTPTHQGACPPGYVPMYSPVSSKAELQAAIQRWISSDGTDSFFGPTINDWDVSAVADFSFLFEGEETFNDPLGDWETSQVTNMASMFRGASLFDQDISGWVSFI